MSLRVSYFDILSVTGTFRELLMFSLIFYLLRDQTKVAVEHCTWKLLAQMLTRCVNSIKLKQGRSRGAATLFVFLGVSGTRKWPCSCLTRTKHPKFFCIRYFTFRADVFFKQSQFRIRAEVCKASTRL